jgi:hypothetical protein
VSAVLRLMLKERKRSHVDRLVYVEEMLSATAQYRSIA